MHAVSLKFTKWIEPSICDFVIIDVVYEINCDLFLIRPWFYIDKGKLDDHSLLAKYRVQFPHALKKRYSKESFKFFFRPEF